jgi:hypothetical protein
MQNFGMLNLVVRIVTGRLYKVNIDYYRLLWIVVDYYRPLPVSVEQRVNIISPCRVQVT